MANVYSTASDYWIKPGALTISLNALDDPQYVQVSVLAGTVIMAYRPNIIDYDASHNFRKWNLEAYNTVFETTGHKYIHARLEKDNSSQKALIVYSDSRLDYFGNSEHASDSSYYYLFLGSITPSVNDLFETVDRQWDDTFITGTLATDQYIREESQGDWKKMFRLNEVTDMIDVLKSITSAVINKLTVGVEMIFKGKKITDIDLSTEEIPFDKISDEHLPSTKFLQNYGEDHFLSRLHNDNALGDIDFEENITVKKLAKTLNLKVSQLAIIARCVVDMISSPTFVDGFTGEGFQIWKSIATGDWNMTLDRLTVRKVFTVFELLVQKIRSVGGMLVVSAADGKIETIELVGDNYEITFATSNGFLENDLIRHQVFSGEKVEYYWTEIKSVDGSKAIIPVSEFEGVEPQIGDECILMGNTKNKLRQSIITIAAIEDGQPRIDVLTGVNKKNFEGNLAVRMGNMDGIKDIYFPADNQPEGDGLYGKNCYLRGTFLLVTGEDVLTKFQIIEGLFRSEISSIRDELQKKDNYLTNSAFASNTNGWLATNDIKLFTVDGKFLYLNRNFYSEKKQVADVVRFEAKSVLRVKNSGVRQLNAELSRRPESGAAKFFMSFRYRVMRAGVLSVGFSGQGLWQEMRLEATDDFTDVEYSGLWDGTGDFELRFTGDAYFYSLAVTDNAFEDYITKFNTKFEQTDKVIDLLAQAVNEVDGKIESEIKVSAEGIKLVNERTDRLGNTLTSMGIVIDGANGTISQFVKKGSVISSINQTAESVSIDASKINLNGAVTFNSFNASLQSTINGKADSSSLGGLAYKSAVEMAQLGSTIIVGGYLNTEYIKVRRIDAYEGNIGLFSINNNGLYSGNASNEAYIYPGKINLKRAYSYSGNVYARNECRLGDDANPESNEYSQGSMVGYFYRNFIATSDKTLYTPAVKIVSANNVGFNVGLEVIGALRVKGGVIEKGYNLSITAGGVNVLDLTLGTSYIILNTLKYSRFYIPTLSQVRRQCGFSEYEPFCIRVSFFGHRLSTEKIAISSQKHAGVSIEEAGILVDNNGNEWDNSSKDFARGDVMEFNLIWSWYGGYYAQIVNVMY